MKHSRGTFGFFSLIIIFGFALTGCSSSEQSMKETQPTLAELVSKATDSLRTENETLKNSVTMLREENSSLTAHVQQLAAQLGMLQEKLAAIPSIPPPPQKPAISDPGESYAAALTLFRSRNYQEAASTFQALLDAGAPMQDKCHYWLGECSYAMKHFDDAIGHLEKVFTFTRSRKKDDSQMMIANSYLAKGDNARAKEEFEKLIKKFPASPYVKRAKEKLQHL